MIYCQVNPLFDGILSKSLYFFNELHNFFPELLFNAGKSFAKIIFHFKNRHLHDSRLKS